MIAATKNSSGAFVRAIESEMMGLLRDTKRAVNRQLHGDGLDALGYFVSGAGATTVYVDDNLGSQFSHFVTGQATTVDLLDASSSYATLNAAVTATVGAWSGANSGFTTTLSSAASGSAADGDPFVVASTKDKQMRGIQGIIDSADPVLLAGGLHGLAVATYPWWTAQVVGSVAAHRVAGDLHASHGAVAVLGARGLDRRWALRGRGRNRRSTRTHGRRAGAR